MLRPRYRIPRIVDPRSAGSRWWLALLAVATAALAGYGLGIGHGGHVLEQRVAAQRDAIARLRAENDALKREREALVASVAAKERASEVDRRAVAEVREALARSEGDRIKLEKELLFLRGIVSASDSKKDLQIQSFALDHGDDPDRFRYRFTVSKVLKNQAVALGQIDLRVHGVQGEQARTLTLAEMTDGASSSLKMRFRYFQPVEGTLQLPPDFVPDSIVIDVKPTTKGLDPISETIDWVIGE